MSQPPLPHITGFTPWVGQSSNAWMHRQFAGMSDQIKSVIAWEYVNQDQYPLPSTEVRLAPQRFEEELLGWRRNLDTLRLRRTGGCRYGRDFEAWLRKQLIALGTESIIAHFGHYAMAAEVACRPLRIPVFAHFHGHDLSARLANKKRYRNSIRGNWHDFAGMIVVAQYQRDRLLELGVDSERIALIPCGAPVSKISEQVKDVQTQCPRQDDELRFLFVGRFCDKKDPVSVVKAFQVCSRSYPEARLWMGGFGDLEADCRQLVNQAGNNLRDKVRFLGKLGPDEVIENMSRVDAYVQHSRVAANADMEGWPVSIGEALCAGLPIIATRHAGIVDQVDEGINGYLCNEGDWQQMGRDLIQFASLSSQQRHEMGQASLNSALDSKVQTEKLRDFMNRRFAEMKRGQATESSAQRMAA